MIQCLHLATLDHHLHLLQHSSMAQNLLAHFHPRSWMHGFRVYQSDDAKHANAKRLAEDVLSLQREFASPQPQQGLLGDESQV